MQKNRADAVSRQRDKAERENFARTPPPLPPRDEVSPRSRSGRGRGATEQGEAKLLPPVPALPVATAQPESAHRGGEPMRELNMLAQRFGAGPEWVDRLEEARSGLWSSQVRALGLSARGSGVGKKNARRAAAEALLVAHEARP